MMLNITPRENPSYNCLDVLIFTLAQEWGIEHRLMFSGSWRFRYEKAAGTAGAVSFEEALDVKELVEKRDIEGALSKYHGLLIERNPMPDIERATALVKRQLSTGAPVALGVDAYHCHWSGAYRKYHLEHYCLAIGIDENKQHFTVIDPYLTNQRVEFPFAQYAETLRDSLSFERSAVVPDSPDWRTLVRGAASPMIHKVQEIRDLAADLERYLDFHQEVSRHEDPFASRLVLYFKTLSFSRLNYAECLTHLGELSGEALLEQGAVRMKEQGNELFKIFLLMMKFSLTPHRFKVGNIAQKLREIADSEGRLAADLLQLSRENEEKDLSVAVEAR
jgi:hypothetical protein